MLDRVGLYLYSAAAITCMKKTLFCVCWILCCFFSTLQAQIGKIQAATGRLIGSTPVVRNMTADPRQLNIAIRDKKGLFWNRGKRKNPEIHWQESARTFREDPLRRMQQAPLPRQPLALSKTLSPEINFSTDGIQAAEITPADPTLCVGPQHLIQMVNGPSGTYFQVYNKSGQPLNAPTYLDNLVANAGYSGAGDGICLYDQYADRYIMSEFGTPAGRSDINTLIFFVSKTNDPLADWYIYQFTDTTYFPDYPKVSVWDDQSYFATSRDYGIPGSEFLGISCYAFNKQQMLSGSSTVQLQKVRLTNTVKYDGTAPINSFGPTPPPAGTPGLFTYRNDDGRTEEADADSVVLFGFSVDYANPSNSSFSTLKSLQTAPFSSLICSTGGYFQTCVTVPGNNANLMATTSFIMDKPVYRRFPGYESILVYHTVNGGGTGVAALRWHELRRTSGDWQLYQEGTYSPDNTNRFFPSMNMNSKGQIAAVFNAASKTIWPSVRVTGRNANDPPGSLPTDETTIASGTGYGTYSSRWGDYSMIAPDPANDSIFWCTSMYGTASGWKTKLAAIRLAPNKPLDAKLSLISSPLSGQIYCDPGDLSTSIQLGNSGTSTLTSVQINWQINGGAVQSTNWTGSLIYGNTVNVALPVTVAVQGQYTLKIFLTKPNGGVDQRPANDSLSTSFTVQLPVNGIIQEGFESTVFPPAGWSVVNPNAGSVTWARTTVASNSGSASAYMNLFNYDSPDDQDFLVSPSLLLQNTDSVRISFAHAHKPYSFSPNFSDTLMLMASLDCGNTFTELIWKKGGPDLASTAGATGDINWVPVTGDWQQNTISIPVSRFKGAGSVVFAWISVNKFGQNIYLDDISIAPYTLPQRDISVIGISSPPAETCDNQFRPVLTVRNNGRQIVNSFQLQLQLNDGSLVTRQFDSLSLGTGDTYTISYDSSFQLPQTGINVFRAIVSRPNGQADQLLFNDTLQRRIFLFTTATAPWQEGFEHAGFLLANWDTVNAAGTIGWQASNAAASEGTRSAYIRNFINPVSGDIDDLITPPASIGAADSIFLKFDLAYLNSKTSDQPTDTLQVFLTQDCGRSSILIYNKWGTSLQTVTDPNVPSSLEFTPLLSAHWRTDSIPLTGLIDPSQPVQFIFRNINNRNNDLYLDNLRLVILTLPAKLKSQGFLVTPNPSSGLVQVRIYNNQENLRRIEVVNMTGQQIWAREYSQSAGNLLNIDLSRQSSGVYLVRLIYSDGIKSTRIIKITQ